MNRSYEINRRQVLGAAGAFASLAVLGRTPRASAAMSLRIAAVVPEGSSFSRVFTVWNAMLSKETAGKLKLDVESAADEHDLVQKMRTGKVHGAVLSSYGLSQFAPAALVLQSPAACPTYERMDVVRTALAADLDREFTSAGYGLLGWADTGQLRLFSSQPVAAPADLKNKKIACYGYDPTWAAILKACGAHVTPVSTNAVLAALGPDQHQACVGPSLRAAEFKWNSKTKFVTDPPWGVAVGATVLSKAKLDAMEPGMRSALLQTADKAHRALKTAIRRDDRRSFETLLDAGMKPSNWAAARPEWDRAFKKASSSLVGKLYPAELLRKIEALG